MLLEVSLPGSLLAVLEPFVACFTGPSFRTFAGLVAGHVAQTGRRTVCGMLVGAGLSRAWPHDRAHRFFAAARWSADRVGVRLASVIVATLLPPGAPLVVAVDDTLFKRTGRRVHGACWQHDGSAPQKKTVGFGNGWVVAGVIVTLPVVTRPVCLPVLARLWRPGTGPSQVELAVELAGLLAAAVPDRDLHVLGDAGYRGPALRGLPPGVHWTCRLQRNAALYRPAPPRTGTVGRPRLKGDRLPPVAALADTLTWTTATLTRYGRVETVQIAELVCLWYTVWHTRPVRVVLVRDRDTDQAAGYGLALVSTDQATPAGQLIERYATRWAIEVAFHDAKQTLGVGQARNRTPAAVERTVPFGLITLSLAILWYTDHGHHPGDLADRRATAPWYTTKTDPSIDDMLAKLRRVLIANRYLPQHHHKPTPEEIRAVQAAWAAACA